MACVDLADVLCPSLPPLKAGGVFCLLRAGVLVFRVDIARGGWVKEGRANHARVLFPSVTLGIDIVGGEG